MINRVLVILPFLLHWLIIHILFPDQQEVSTTVHWPLLYLANWSCIAEGVLIRYLLFTSYHMINRKHVNLPPHHAHHIWLPCPIVCEKYHLLGLMEAYQSLPTMHSMSVTLHFCLLPWMINNDKKECEAGSSTTFWNSFHINRMWVAFCCPPSYTLPHDLCTSATNGLQNVGDKAVVDSLHVIRKKQVNSYPLAVSWIILHGQ